MLSKVAVTILSFALLACAQLPPPLPAGLSLTVRLESVLDSEKAEVGDLLVATVTKGVKVKSKVIVPAKSTLRGRLRVLDRKSTQVAVGMQFTELESVNTKTLVVMELDRVVTQLPGTQRIEPGTLDRSPRPEVGAAVPTVIVNEPRGVGTFVVLRPRFKFPHLEMVWRTLPVE